MLRLLLRRFLAEKVHVPKEVPVPTEQIPVKEVAPIPPIDDDDTLIDDTDTTICASTEASVHTGGAFSRGPNDICVITEYADHVTYRV